MSDNFEYFRRKKTDNNLVTYVCMLLYNGTVLGINQPRSNLSSKVIITHQSSEKGL